jgi:hypothetical protein
MIRGVFTACLLLACSMASSLAAAKDPAQLLLHKGARVGIVSMLDAEITHFHTTPVLTDSFYKTHPLTWQVDSMLTEAVSPRLRQLELVPVTLAASEGLLRDREEYFVNSSLAKGLPREVARQLAQLAASERLDALLVLAPSLNNSSQAGGKIRKGLPDYLRGWGFITGDTGEAPSLFNMTQVLLIGVTSDGVTLNAREWGGSYTEQWTDYVAPANAKRMPPELLDKLQSPFARILAQQADHVLAWMTVTP